MSRTYHCLSDDCSRTFSSRSGRTRHIKACKDVAAYEARMAPLRVARIRAEEAALREKRLRRVSVYIVTLYFGSGVGAATVDGGCELSLQQLSYPLYRSTEIRHPSRKKHDAGGRFADARDFVRGEIERQPDKIDRQLRLKQADDAPRRRCPHADRRHVTAATQRSCEASALTTPVNSHRVVWLS